MRTNCAAFTLSYLSEKFLLHTVQYCLYINPPHQDSYWGNFRLVFACKLKPEIMGAGSGMAVPFAITYVCSMYIRVQ
jgi:hypothetical protein